MIKITVNPEKEPKSYQFDQEVVVIGDGSPESVHICFPSEGLHLCHIKIVLKEGFYWVINQANDPFVTLNGQPFGKKKLEALDVLELRNHRLHFDEISFGKAQPIPQDLTNFPDIESLAEEDNPQGWFPQELPQVEIKKNAPITEHVSPLEEAYNLAEQKPLRKAEKQPFPPPSKGKKVFKLVVFAMFAAFALLALTLIEVYFRANVKNEQEEMLAAESIADYAMALTYAKVYHIAPQKNSWIDPQFIKNNLIDLLSTTSIPCGNIDAQGDFSNCPYILRFYTNRDFSRFLLIAQPSPTFTQWLIPKQTLIVDSNRMDLRKTNDLQTLNRLLSYATPLDGANGNEISAAIAKTEVIALSSLSKAIQKKEFAPPRALSYIKPGAENLIYNAPRYYNFSETLLKKISTITEDPKNLHEVAILQSELDSLANFHDLVFYSSNGIREATLSHRALRKLVLPSNFFTGYLLFDSKGNIVNSHLVIDSEKERVPMEDTPQDQAVAEEDPTQTPIPKGDTNQELLGALLSRQASALQAAVRPILLGLNTFLSEAIEKESVYLSPGFTKLFKSYGEIKEKARQTLVKSLEEFRKAHPDMNEFIIERLLREYGLLDLYNSEPAAKTVRKNSSSDKFSTYQKWKSFRALNELCKKPPPVPLKDCRNLGLL